eukprot:TRINITY_DN94536_c0_g1_i1.p1 TRINITY_DN94536_c0_g1~~TRINITY_DN94536_c0_g1_i1.p1  ORF type:complete len:104 (-),score=28.27 TRINITY_DN94536_c0_g1_i1:115-426(-)
MAVFQNTSVCIKVLEPKDPKDSDDGDFYWGMVGTAAPKDLFKIKATGNMKVKELKSAIAKEKGYAVEAQRLLLFGGELQDHRTLESCGFMNTDDPLLHMITKL